jgi:hypothetical protein
MTRTQFIVAIAIEIGKSGKLAFGEELRRASAAYQTFEADNGVEFGDPSFAWTEDAAGIIAREYDTDHWEAA